LKVKTGIGKILINNSDCLKNNHPRIKMKD
jgi:hypothetical protein